MTQSYNVRAQIIINVAIDIEHDIVTFMKLGMSIP